MRSVRGCWLVCACVCVFGCGPEEVVESSPWFLRFDDGVQAECTEGSSVAECERASCLFMDSSINSRGTLDVLLENRCEQDLFMRFERAEVELQDRGEGEHPGVAGFGRMYVGGEEAFVFGGWFWREEGVPAGGSIVEVTLGAGEKTFMFDVPTLCSQEASTCRSWEEDVEGSAGDIRRRLERGERVDVEIELPIPSFERGDFLRYEGCSGACGVQRCDERAGFMTFVRPAAYSPGDLNLGRCGSRANVGG